MSTESSLGIEKFEFNQDYQLKLVAMLLRNPNFLVIYKDLIQPDYFTSIYLITIVNKIYIYHSQYRTNPSKTALETIIMEEGRAQNFDSELMANYSSFLNTIYHIDIAEEEFIEKSVRLFCRKREYNKAMKDAYNLMSRTDISEGDLDRISKIWIDVANKGYGSDMGLNLKEIAPGFQTMLQTEYSNVVRIPGAIPHLNQIMHGGYTRKGLHIWMAPPERGKTTAMCGEACAFLRQGYTVHFYTAELSELQILTKIMTNMTGMTTEQMMTPIYDAYYQEKIQEWLKYKPNIHVKFYQRGTANANTLLAHSSKLNLLSGIPADVIMADYIDLFNPVGGNKDNIHTDQGATYSEFRNIGDTLNTAVIGACQPKLEGYDAPLLGMQHMSGSVQKSQIIDTLITMNQTQDERNQLVPLVRLFNGKVRFGDAYKYAVTCEFHYGLSFLREIRNEKINSLG